MYPYTLQFSQASELFVQVLNQSVAIGEHTQNEEEKKYSALIQFTEITNNAFDILNTRYRSEKKQDTEQVVTGGLR